MIILNFLNQDLPIYKDWQIKMWFAILLPFLFASWAHEPHLILYFIGGLIIRYILDNSKSYMKH